MCECLFTLFGRAKKYDFTLITVYIYPVFAIGQFSLALELRESEQKYTLTISSLAGTGISSCFHHIACKFTIICYVCLAPVGGVPFCHVLSI